MAKIQRRYRTILQRIAATFIDGIIFLPVSWLLYWLADTSSLLKFICWTLFSYGVWLAYSVIMHGRYGQTIGKKASSVKVYTLDEKTIIGYERAFLRESIGAAIVLLGLIYTFLNGIWGEDPRILYNRFTAAPIFISGLLEIITTLFSPKRRSLHDLIAGSVVLDITKYRKWDFEYEAPADHIREDKA